MFAPRAPVPRNRAHSSGKQSPRPEPAGHDSASPEARAFSAPAYRYSLAGMPILPPSGSQSNSSLTIGAADDPFEREADKVAGNVVGMKIAPASLPHPRIQRKAASPGASISAPSPVHQAIHQVLSSPGQPLAPAARAFFEPRFGCDLSRVRIHADAHAGQSAAAVHARAYTLGNQIVFAPGQYSHTDPDRTRLLAHELTHVIQQGASSDGVLHRQPAATTTVEVGKDKKDLPQGAGGSGAVIYEYTAVRMTEPPGMQQRDAEIKKEKKDGTFDPKNPPDNPDIHDEAKRGGLVPIKLPILVFPPSKINTSISPPKVDIFVFFHGMRATYKEGTKTQASQGDEEIASMNHLKDAVGTSGRLGIAPQAPETFVFSSKAGQWINTSAQWKEVFGQDGFDSLIQTVLDSLSKDLGIAPPLVAGNISVAGHSGGGQGILEATATKGGAKLFGDKVQDLTLQDATYGFGWSGLADWMLDGSPGKTVRVLLSGDEGGAPGSGKNTRVGISQFLTVDKINQSIADKKKQDNLVALDKPVAKQEDQKARPGGFVLESEIVVENKKGGVTQATIVIFSAPGGGHYATTTTSTAAAASAGPGVTTGFLGEATPGKYRVTGNPGITVSVYAGKDLNNAKTLRELPLETEVEVTAIERREPQDKKDTSAQPYIAKIKIDNGGKAIEGWVRMANLTKP